MGMTDYRSKIVSFSLSLHVWLCILEIVLTCCGYQANHDAHFTFKIHAHTKHMGVNTLSPSTLSDKTT
jgi:hypothetical protein